MSKLKKILSSSIILFLCILTIFCIFFNNDIKNLPNTIIVNQQEDLLDYKSHSAFANLITIDKNDEGLSQCYSSNFNHWSAELKLFGIFPIKRVEVNQVIDNKIWASGKTVGIALNSKGVVVVGKNPVISATNKDENCNLKIGDTICEIEGEYINSAETIENILNNERYSGKELVVKGKRDNQTFYTTIKPIFDEQTLKYKIGYWVRDDASGIGTLTYVRQDNLRFGALGHSISDVDTGTVIDVEQGKLYKCQILSVDKGEKGKAGQMRGLFIQGENAEAQVDTNNSFGIYGNMYENSPLMNDLTQYEIGGRLTARPGKAQILCSVDGKNIEKYDIEIIKTNYQSCSNDKSIVFKVTDKNLLQKTGGIVQGMSGSPIVQNGKLIGAVTHVFVNDATKGFGVYLDWMIEN